MNKTIELVNEWRNFERNHPQGELADFCRHYLAQQKEQKQEGTLVGGVVPRIPDGLLMKLIGRIGKLNSLYANKALKGTGLNQIEEFGMLMTIRQERNPRKTEVIYANLFELSSGTDMLNRMKKRGLIKEYDDKEDKRAKRIILTAKGEKIAAICAERIQRNATLMAHSLSNDDKGLCIQLLKGIEVNFSALWPQHKGKTFEEIYNSIIKDDLTENSKKK